MIANLVNTTSRTKVYDMGFINQLIIGGGSYCTDEDVDCYLFTFFFCGCLKDSIIAKLVPEQYDSYPTRDIIFFLFCLLFKTLFDSKVGRLHYMIH